MRRTGHLFEAIVDHDNLRQAFARACRGKRHSREAREFASQLDTRLHDMAHQLRFGDFAVGRYRQFVIHDPKERIITAPCFAERVLHHAIMNVCEPVFERRLIDDTFACRKGRGRIVCLARARGFSRKFPAYLKLDIRKYFDSISHQLLQAGLERLFKDEELLALFARIVYGFRGMLGRGLPIGSLTSQHFANFYLGPFDRFVKQDLRRQGYVRYMDDMVIWGSSTRELAQIWRKCRDYLRDELRLEIRPTALVNRTQVGLDFLGCRVFSTHLGLNRRSKLRLRRRLRDVERAYLAGKIDSQALQQQATAMLAFAVAGGVKSWRWRTRVVNQLVVGDQ